MPNPSSKNNDMSQALIHCKKSITVGSKSFSLASFLFSTRVRHFAFFLYAWCRHCDDVIDGAKDQAEAETQLTILNLKTKKSFQNIPENSDFVFQGFREVILQCQIPSIYPLELLEGMSMDVQKVSYQNFEQLHLYCYRVAGVVGLMMSHIMGVSDERALKHASDLGIAMQLTNISRDVLEDAQMGRVYLPSEWLKEVGISPAQVSSPEYRVQVSQVVRRLLMQSEVFYQSGRDGLQYLSLRSALAIGSAHLIYSEIGRLVLMRGEKAWETRVIVPFGKKLWLMFISVLFVLKSIPSRILNPYRNTPIKQIWKA